ncbi:DUF6518 family protein [Isoptericola sp. NPDC058082]|uniref:DUF6518 family protein n=1 Tax=Isoptericola sp. NPDC058082 TaxID=3346331 RepID=UPI0036E2E67E
MPDTTPSRDRAVAPSSPRPAGPAPTPSTPAPWGRPWTRGAVVLVASLLLGGLTSFAQGVLPAAVVPVANSASGWTLVSAVLVYWWAAATGARTWQAAVLGAASFVLLVLGYTFAADLRGLVYRPLLFSVVGVVVGPFVGVAAAWLRRPGTRAALGTALLAGVGVGDGVYGLTTVADTTGATYWVAIGVVAVVLLASMLASSLRGAFAVATAVAGTVVVAALFVVAFRSLGGAA